MHKMRLQCQFNIFANSTIKNCERPFLGICKFFSPIMSKIHFYLRPHPINLHFIQGIMKRAIVWNNGKKYNFKSFCFGTILVGKPVLHVNFDLLDSVLEWFRFRILKAIHKITLTFHVKQKYGKGKWLD